MPVAEDIQRRLDEQMGRPVNKAVTIVGPNGAGDFHMDFEDTKKRLQAVYLCPWDRAPILAIWEHGGKPIGEQQLNGFFGISSFVRMNRKGYEMALIKIFSTADLQGVVFYDHVPGMSEAGVAQLANAEAQMLMDARSAKDRAAEAKIEEAMKAGRHGHTMSYVPYMSSAEAVQAKVTAAFEGRMGPMKKGGAIDSDAFVIVRGSDPRTVLDDVFMRILYGLLQVAEETMRTDEYGRRVTRTDAAHMSKMPEGVEERIQFAQHFSRMYFRSIKPGTMKRLTEDTDDNFCVLTPLPELTGKGKPVYILNLTLAYRKVDLYCHRLWRPGMPRKVPSGGGYSEPEFDNVLLLIETLIHVFSDFGDMQLPPQLTGYIRERTGEVFELVQDRVTRGTETAGRELIRKWEREQQALATKLFVEWPPTPEEKVALEKVHAGEMTEEAFEALPEDVKEIVQKWITTGIAVDAKSGKKTYKPFGIRFAGEATTWAIGLLKPAEKPVVEGPGVPEFVLSVDRLRDVKQLVEEARTVARKGSAPAVAKPEQDRSGYLWLRGATLRYKDAIKELPGAEYHPTEQTWTVNLRSVDDVPSSSPVYHAIKRGEITALELTPEEFAHRYGRR